MCHHVGRVLGIHVGGSGDLAPPIDGARKEHLRGHAPLHVRAQALGVEHEGHVAPPLAPLRPIR
eukprot:6668975-Alexandrium_andersonii.AAC.1